MCIYIYIYIYTQLPRLLCYSNTYATTKHENGGSLRTSLGDLEKEKYLAFAGIRTPNRLGRNAGTGHVEHNMMVVRNSAGRNCELHDSMYSTHDEHYV